VSDPIDTSHTENITCPYCGHVDRDSWEWGGESDDGTVGFAICGKCDKQFAVVKDIEVTYSTRKV
jgi:transcription elongation factor Elf1